MISRHKTALLIALSILLVGTAFFVSSRLTAGSSQSTGQFDGARAYNDVIAQIALGPRTPDSRAHEDVVAYIREELAQAGWDVSVQQVEEGGHTVQNIIARHGKSENPIILGAHYDSRLKADQDPDPFLSTQPVPGANDGASGVAVLLELARVMPKTIADNVWLVFFDAEDQGDLPGWDWILGSKAFVAALDQKIKSVVVIDMIGDKEMNIYREKSSTPELTNQIWAAAKSLGYAQEFIDEEKYNMLDDHTPFLEAGIPAVDIIDFDYPYWHTAADLADKVSSQSLKIVGDTLLAWLANE